MYLILRRAAEARRHNNANITLGRSILLARACSLCHPRCRGDNDANIASLSTPPTRVRGARESLFRSARFLVIRYYFCRFFARALPRILVHASIPFWIPECARIGKPNAKKRRSKRASVDCLHYYVRCAQLYNIYLLNHTESLSGRYLQICRCFCAMQSKNFAANYFIVPN